MKSCVPASKLQPRAILQRPRWPLDDPAALRWAMMQSICSHAEPIKHATSLAEVKRGIYRATSIAAQSLNKQKRLLVTASEIAKVATISARGDGDVGRLIAEALVKVGHDGAVILADNACPSTFSSATLDILDGMRVHRSYSSAPTIVPSPSAEVHNAFVLIISAAKIATVQSLLPALVHSQQRGRPLVVVGDVDCSLPASFHQKLTLSSPTIFFVTVPKSHGSDVLQDLAIYTGANVCGSEHFLSSGPFDPSVLGGADRIICRDDDAVFISGHRDKSSTAARVAQLHELSSLELSDYKRQTLRGRMQKLTQGVAAVTLGGPSAAAKRSIVAEALHATRPAVEEGIVAGGGTALLRASLELNSLDSDPTLSSNERLGVSIVRTATRLPAHVLALDAGREGPLVSDRLMDELQDPFAAYDAIGDVVVTALDGGIVEPVRALKAALVDVSSAAGTLLTQSQT